MAAPSELIDDAIAEILLRLPPDDPACLVRASLVCKLWRHILSDPTFPNRYGEFHRTPPLLGYLCSISSRFGPIAARIPFHQPAFRYRDRALDCRHGRALFNMFEERRQWGCLAVWDPITGDHKELSNPHPESYFYSGVVICATTSCNHRRGCHGSGPFHVVFVSTCTSYNHNDNTIVARAWVYSSETAAWSAPTASLHLPKHSDVYIMKRGALVGDQIYFLTSSRILTYDLGKHCMSMICLPCKYTNCYPGVLMAIDDSSSLGLAVIKDLTLDLWARKVNSDGSMGWVQDRVVSLINNLVPIIETADTCKHVKVIGFAEGVDILLLGAKCSGFFVFELKSGQFKKLKNPEYHYRDVFPYLSFYIPDFASHKSPLPVEAK